MFVLLRPIFACQTMRAFTRRRLREVIQKHLDLLMLVITVVVVIVFIVVTIFAQKV